MTKTAFIFHGSGGSSNGHWLPWLKEKLEERGLEVIVPQFPIEKNQSLENWLEVIDNYKDKFDNSLMIGHSLGSPFIINVLNKYSCKIKAAYLVAGFVGRLEFDEPRIHDFSDRDFNWSIIRNNCNNFHIIHADNDQIVPLYKAEELSELLSTDITLIKDGGHLNSFIQFELLLEQIEIEI